MVQPARQAMRGAKNGLDGKQAIAHYQMRQRWPSLQRLKVIVMSLKSAD